MSTRTSERLSLAGQLRRALKREDELVLHFQPKVAVATGDLVGAEALVRWQHPERGLLGPLEFVGLAEEIGLGPELGDWILRKALSQSSGWRAAGDEPVPIAVNLADSQCRSQNLLDRITQIISTGGFDSRNVELEITETVVVHNQLADSGLLAEFRARGFKTAIDDFGTGLSTLSTLRRLAVETLKIDRSFIRDLESSATDRVITSSIIDMGQQLGMTVLAEGVETKNQLEALTKMGCDQAQGFLFSGPLPAQRFEQRLVEMGGRTLLVDSPRASARGTSVTLPRPRSQRLPLTTVRSTQLFAPPGTTNR